MKKIKIGVLMGGMSIEQEVSFNSGRTICDHLDTNLYEVIPLFQTSDNKLYILPWRFLHRGKITDFKDRLSTQAESIKWDHLKTVVDFVYIALHGRYAEDGTIQGLLEVLNIPYLGTKVWGSAISMDKIAQKKLLKKAGISVAKDWVVEPKKLKKFDVKKVTLPVVVKPNKEGSSLGISVVFNQKDLLPAIKKAATVDPTTSQSVLIEEKIEGMEFCSVTLFDKDNNPIYLPSTEIVHEPGTHLHDYEQKYMPGRSLKFTPARISKKETEKIQQTCLRVAQTLEFKTIARTDGFLKKDGTVVIIDPNSLTGMAPSSFLFNQAAAIGMNHADLINHLIQVELEQQNIMIPEKKSLRSENKKLQVAVLMGGSCNEKETSLDSGRNICYKLSPQKYEVVPLFVDAKNELYPLNQKLLVHNSTKEIEHDIDRTTKIDWHDLPQIADFVFIGLHGGIGENGSVQGLLEFLKLPYNGSGIATSALCIDKYKTNLFLQSEGFDVAKSYLIKKNTHKKELITHIEHIVKDFEFPLIVKPSCDGCSVGVKKVNSKKDLETAIYAIQKRLKSDTLIEEYITGMELTVGAMGNKDVQVFVPSQTVCQSDILTIEEKFLPGAGQNLTPAPLQQNSIKFIQETIKKVYTAVGCAGYARIDCFYQHKNESPTKKERVVIIEINTLPGMTPATCIFHQAAEANIKPMEFIDTIIRLGLEKKEP